MKDKIWVNIIAPLIITVATAALTFIFSTMEILRIAAIVVFATISVSSLLLVVWRVFVRNFVEKKIAESRAEIERELRAEMQEIALKSDKELKGVVKGIELITSGQNNLISHILDFLKDR